ncbi:LamG-like jellyroll fold domain-containing protein [Mycobacterium sp. B14F4]|uniref:LamG-like jellyroll fold domain-containing protein n=1 Tax=Mycobacterium sp. B14F4 TaxID=3153565 RepID=UPI00325D3C59
MTEAVWVALAVLAVPIVLVLATAGCGTVLAPAADDVATPAPETPPQGTGPGSATKKPDPRIEASAGLAIEVELKRSYASTVLDTVGLVGYWRLGEAQAELLKPQPLAQNLSNTPNLNGRYMSPGAVELEVKGALAKGDDGAARFDGGYVEVPFQPVLQLDEVALELWLKIDAPDTPLRTVVGYFETPPFNDTLLTRGFRLRARTVLESGASVLLVQGMFGGMSTALEVKHPTAAGWHYVVLTYNMTLGQEKAELYVDDQMAIANGKCTLKLAGQQPLRFAVTTGLNLTTFNGSLDEVALYGQYMPKATVDDHRAIALSA